MVVKMAAGSLSCLVTSLFCFLIVISTGYADILGCGGFIKSHVNLDFSKVQVKLFTKQGSLKEKTECGPNGYYFLPLYEHGDYVLKVDPPPGWSIEPAEIPLSIDGSSDACSKGQDVNFSFDGFGITGRVVTAGDTAGPAGVGVRLVGEGGEARETRTKAGGDFHFTPVIPGKYTVKAFHSKWKLEPSSTVVQVAGGNTALKVGSLAVKGYDVQGKVLSEGRPLAGVNVLLYSEKGTNPQFRIEGCDTSLLPGVSGNPICHAKTAANGDFTFGLVPAGKYSLEPLPRSPAQARVALEIKPEKQEFTVQHDSVVLQTDFEVTGFSVDGRVVTHVGGAGMAGAQVVVSGRPPVTTAKDGSYTLRNLKAGSHNLQISAEDCEFEPTSLSISAVGVANLVDAHPARWRVCGTVRSPGDSSASRTVAVQSAPPAQAPLLAVADAQGRWCLQLAPGTYLANVQVSDEDRSRALQFFPLSQKVSVGHGPVEGVVFSQLKARLSGSVRCLPGASACAGAPITLRPLAPDGSYIGQPVQTKAKDGKYTFLEVLPGSYEVSVPAEALCWSSAKHNIAVTSTEATVPGFEQTGYAVSFTMSHKSEVSFSSGEKKGDLQVMAGVSQHCLPAAGEYTFTPRGCHIYEPATVTYNTRQPNNMIVINAVSHSVEILVMSLEVVDDLKLRIGRETPEEVGPLKPQPRGQDNMVVYRHTMMLPQGSTVMVTPLSGKLLFSPPGPRPLSVGSDCLEAALQLTAARGRVLAGQVRPPIAGVTVTLRGGEQDISQVTGPDGKFHFGPLDATMTHSLLAEKESYVLTGPDAAGDFHAQKLAEIIVKVVDAATNEPLQSALVSVSGGAAYRRNLATGPSGRLAFPSLAPGDYYLKPLMKEYRFQPPHRSIPVKEGETHEVTLSGVRVACSLVGLVRTLGGGGLGGMGVLAAPAPGEDAARCPPEEAQSERDSGAFRVRGLLRGCSYRLSLNMLKELGVAHVIPPFIDLHVESEAEDIEGLRFIAVQPLLVTDVSVLVVAPRAELYKTLKLRLATEAEPSGSVFSVRLDPAGQPATGGPGIKLTLPRLPAVNKTYVLHLESSLSRSANSYNVEPIYFNSDGKFKHFTMRFTPKAEVSTQELSQPSFLILPLLGLIILGVLNWDRCSALLSGAAAAAAASLQAPPRAPAPKVQLDDGQIDRIVQDIDAVKKRPRPRKV